MHFASALRVAAAGLTAHDDPLVAAFARQVASGDLSAAPQLARELSRVSRERRQLQSRPRRKWTRTDAIAAGIGAGLGIFIGLRLIERM